MTFYTQKYVLDVIKTLINSSLILNWNQTNIESSNRVLLRLDFSMLTAILLLNAHFFAIIPKLYLAISYKL